jgi:hypothetical protein
LISGAATAFGLTSLLPLNVPAHKPMMYCNSTGIAQTKIQLDDNIYSCENNSIAISCRRSYENTIIDTCLNKTMKCDIVEGLDDLYCTNATLMSRSASVCNSTTILNGTNVNETTTIINCYLGLLPQNFPPFFQTTTKFIPVGFKVHNFFLEYIAEFNVQRNETARVSEALTTQPETTTPEPIRNFFVSVTDIKSAIEENLAEFVDIR